MKKTNHMTIEEAYKYVNERNKRNVYEKHVYIDIVGHKGAMLYRNDSTAETQLKNHFSEKTAAALLKLVFPVKAAAYIPADFPLDERLINGGTLTTYKHVVKVYIR